MTYRADSGPVEALRDITFRVERGELVTLVGPSGCGKSTLLGII
ncbi:MAG TPA: ATP-binding cassette domain-containing protein, partial [Candidatus Binatia bacterium]|nr:ATP-binding cassette domain-containing protein [Candidatus Binatia bacterium]